MIEEYLIGGFIPLLIGAVAWFVVKWMNGVDATNKAQSTTIHNITHRLENIEKSMITSNDCYARYMRVKQAFERDRYRLANLEQQSQITPPAIKCRQDTDSADDTSENEHNDTKSSL